MMKNRHEAKNEDSTGLSGLIQRCNKYNPFKSKTKEPEEGESYYDKLFGATLRIKEIVEEHSIIIVEYEGGQSRIFTFRSWTWSIDSGRFRSDLHGALN